MDPFHLPVHMRCMFRLIYSKLTLQNATCFYCVVLLTQVVLVYLQWFRRSSLFKCVSQPKIAKNTKTLILGVQSRSRSSMLVLPESSSAVLVMISSKSVYLQPFSR